MNTNELDFPLSSLGLTWLIYIDSFSRAHLPNGTALIFEPLPLMVR